MNKKKKKKPYTVKIKKQKFSCIILNTEHVNCCSIKIMIRKEEENITKTLYVRKCYEYMDVLLFFF